MTQPSNPRDDDWSLDKTNLGKAADELRREIAGSHQRLRMLIVRAYILAIAFGEDPVQWERFRSRPFYRGRKPNNILRAVMRYIFNAPNTNGPNYERACCYTVALHPSWAEKVWPESVAALIDEAGGIENLYCRGKEARRAQQKEAKAENGDDHVTDALSDAGDGVAEDSTSVLDGRDLEPDSVSDNPLAGDKAGDTTSGKPATPRGHINGASPDSSAERGGSTRKYTRAWCEERFVGDFTDEAFMAEVLNLNIDGEELFFSLSRTKDDPDGFKHYLITQYYE